MGVRLRPVLLFLLLFAANYQLSEPLRRGNPREWPSGEPENSERDHAANWEIRNFVHRFTWTRVTNWRLDTENAMPIMIPYRNEIINS